MQEIGFMDSAANSHQTGFSYSRDDTSWDDDCPRSKLEWTWHCWLIVALILISAIGFQWLFYLRYTPATVTEDAVLHYEKFLHKEAYFVETLAPDQYWDYLSKQNNRSKAEEIKKAKEAAKDYLWDSASSYSVPDVQFQILDQDLVDPSEGEFLIQALTKRGIDPDTIGTCKELSVEVTVETSVYPTRTRTLYAVQIGEYWYLLYQDPKNSEDYHFLVEDRDYYANELSSTRF